MTEEYICFNCFAMNGHVFSDLIIASDHRLDRTDDFHPTCSVCLEEPEIVIVLDGNTVFNNEQSSSCHICGDYDRTEIVGFEELCFSCFKLFSDSQYLSSSLVDASRNRKMETDEYEPVCNACLRSQTIVVVLNLCEMHNDVEDRESRKELLFHKSKYL